MSVKEELLAAMDSYGENEDDIVYVDGDIETDEHIAFAEFTVWTRERIYFPELDSIAALPHVNSVSRDPPPTTNTTTTHGGVVAALDAAASSETLREVIIAAGAAQFDHIVALYEYVKYGEPVPSSMTISDAMQIALFDTPYTDGESPSVWLNKLAAKRVPI